MEVHHRSSIPYFCWVPWAEYHKPTLTTSDRRVYLKIISDCILFVWNEVDYYSWSVYRNSLESRDKADRSTTEVINLIIRVSLYFL